MLMPEVKIENSGLLGASINFRARYGVHTALMAEKPNR
jgi:hypothetical protein